MPDNRIDDIGKKRVFRSSSSRLFQNQGAWYFETREGTTEGPYYDREPAERLLLAYTSVMSSRFAPDMELSMLADDDNEEIRKH